MYIVRDNIAAVNLMNAKHVLIAFSLVVVVVNLITNHIQKHDVVYSN